jgi:diguanylate cyclase (GGDEF)-like protein
VLPLRGSAGVIGALSLVAAEPAPFAEDELRLLTQLAHDISFALEYIETQEKLAYLAWHDPLTGLGNRALLHEQLSDALQAAMFEASAVAVLVWDVQRFRTINDSYGRETGDALLRELAARTAGLWPELAHIARLSADNFAGFIVKASDPSDIAHLLEKSKTALNAPFAIDDGEILVGVSIGIACYPHDGGDADALLNNAEAALKQAKMRGEHYLFYEAAMNSRVAEKLSLESKLRGALDKDQFVLHYQSKIDLATNEVSGLEALMRWNDPEKGLVPPTDFIPLLEETGLILDVGRWAIRKALEDWKTRQARGLPTPRIAVNVSAMQLRRADFVSDVEKMLAEVCGARDALELEITESVIMEDIEGNTAKLHALKAMGVNIAIDDFGTGYSSLSYLAKLPMDALKIDRGFIATMVAEPQSMTIVSTIISLAHALRMVVVAEGVESDEHATLLRRLGCEQAQGFFYARPVPWAEAFAKQPARLPPS